MAKKIAIIVQEEFRRKKLADKFYASGADVIESEHALDLDNLAKSGDVDLLVVDLHFSDTDVDVICTDVKTDPQTKLIPVIMLIEENDSWFLERAQKAKADVVLPYQDFHRIAGEAQKLLNLERRVETRKTKLQYYLVESSQRTTFHGTVRDLSHGGLAFTTDNCPLEAGMLVDIGLKIPHLPVFLIRAVTVRVHHGKENYRGSLKFKSFKSGDQHRLKTWVDQQWLEMNPD